jgi:hypothetical protein
MKLRIMDKVEPGHQWWDVARIYFAACKQDVKFFKGWFDKNDPWVQSWFHEIADATPEVEGLQFIHKDTTEWEAKPRNWPAPCLIYRYEEKWIDYTQSTMNLIYNSPKKDKWLQVLDMGEPVRGHTEMSRKKSFRTLTLSNGESYRTTHWRLKALNHAMSAETMLDTRLETFETIIEFGAGSGELAHTILDSGWKGQYIIIDYPELQKIQRWYLENFPVQFYNNFEDVPEEGLGKTLFLSTWGFSETPLKLRAALIKKLRIDAWAIATQKDFGELDNFDYFLNQFPVDSGTFLRLSQMDHGADGGNMFLGAWHKSNLR